MEFVHHHHAKRDWFALGFVFVSGCGLGWDGLWANGVVGGLNILRVKCA